MNRTLINRLIDDQSGAIAVWMAGGMFSMLGLAAIAVDSGHLYAEHNKLQATADAAVLAASYEFTGSKNEKDSRDAALDYAERNMPQASYGKVLDPLDVKFGKWDDKGGFSISPPSTATAIQVTLRRTAASGNPTETFFAKLLGYNTMDMMSQSVAALGSPGCNGGTMFMAGEKVQMGQDINLSAGTCVYGREAVTAGQDPIVQAGAFIGALDVSTISFGQDPSIPDGAVGEADIQPTMANNINQIIADLMSNDPKKLPPHISRSEVVSKLPKVLESGVAYVVTSSVSIDQDYTLSDVIIATTESISFGQDGKIRNSAGNCQIGGGTAIGLYAAKNISIGQDVIIEGAQIVAGETVTIGQDMLGLSASIEAGKDLVIGQNPSMSACQGAVASGGGGASVASRLVQ